ncbi:MAG TPA: zinc ABC transporter substrate-binding protein [Candidatus Dormibacteraeota bacterium]|jgi:zinc/manganese transport system substrate-binding protein|nr:zinc ABC transporter substrate-binding protein [Candidatus Dormibacteraeota bacterium]
MNRRRGPALLAAAALATLLAACGGASAGTGSATSGRHLSIVVAENFWGSIVTQLGGSQVSVLSIVSDPNADPHDYQSSAGNARAFATASYVVVNGAGYDNWAGSLLSANTNSDRKVFTVADLLGKKQGDNPHFWYNPDFVTRFADQVTRDLSALDSADAAYFAQQRAAFDTALKPYRDGIAAVKQQYSGRKVAATETIFQYMADALGLTVITPPEFMKAVAEGNDPPAETVSTFQQQLQSKQAGVLVYNLQTSTAVTTNLRQIATQQAIPVVGITETMQPPETTFQLWMTAELSSLQNALKSSTPSGY